MKVECEMQADALLGECPVWDSKENILYWVDILGQKLHFYDPYFKKNKTFHFPEIVTSVALRKSGGLILTLRKRFAFFDPSNEKLILLTEVEKDITANRFNDGKCDRSGRFWAGTINEVEWEHSSGILYCFFPNGKVVDIKKEGTCLNGLGWSIDNRTMYVTESLLHTIFSYDFDIENAKLSNKRIFASIPENSGGVPDGLTVDSEGYVWSVLTGLGQVVRFHPNGKIDQVIKFPVPRITSCVFGGKDLSTLYVTSAREKMTDEQIHSYPLSGSLFSVKTKIKGISEPMFLG